jgi:DNA-binding PadR family transcriptional regulator
MSEAGLLSLVRRYPDTTALARRVRDGSLFATLRQLEARGLVMRLQGGYRLTRQGRDELAMARALARLIVRTHSGLP